MWLLENLKHQAWSLFKAFAFTVVSARNVLPRGIHISTSVSSSDHPRKSFSLRPSLITLFETCDLCPIPFPIPSLGLGQLHSFFRSFFFFFLAMLHGLWDLSSWAPGSGSAESWPLSRQGSPSFYLSYCLLFPGYEPCEGRNFYVSQQETSTAKK